MRVKFSVIGLVLLISCGGRSLNSQEYLEWFTSPQNGLIVVKRLPPYAFELRYIPPEFSVLQRLQEKDFIKDSFESQLAVKSKIHEFQFRLSSISGDDFLKTDIVDMNQYHERLEYYMNYVQRDLKLVVEGDTLDCSFSHFERGYGVAPYNTLILAFDAIKETGQSDLCFIYDDQVLGLGRTKFTIEKGNLAKIPDLKL